MHMVGVLPGHRGKELGRILSVKTIEFLRTRGLKEIILHTKDRMVVAINMYLSLGIKPAYTHPTHKKKWEHILEKPVSSECRPSSQERQIVDAK